MVGVAVSVISQTQINFAVPGESVHALLAGRVNEVTFGQPYKEGAAVKSLFEVRLLDPLGKIRKVSSNTRWPVVLAVLLLPPAARSTSSAGPSAKSRADAPPEPRAGSPKRRAVDLTIEQGTAKAVITLPTPERG